jgi:hypothetical protein
MEKQKITPFTILEGLNIAGPVDVPQHTDPEHMEVSIESGEKAKLRLYQVDFEIERQVRVKAGRGDMFVTIPFTRIFPFTSDFIIGLGWIKHYYELPPHIKDAVPVNVQVIAQFDVKEN